MYGNFNIFIGKIIQVHGSQVQVMHNNIKTDFYPYLQSNNSFKKSFSPPKQGEKVILFKGDSVGFVIGGLLDREDAIIGENEIIEFSDGLKIRYSNNKLEILGNTEIRIECNHAKVIAKSITLGGEDGAGVVTGECLCPFTGLPHSDISSKVKASK